MEEIMSKCNLGWNDPINHEGRCCCNCNKQRTLQCHPWNESNMFKGSIRNQVMDDKGNDIWVCLALDEAIVMDRKHSMCEMHEFKDIP